MPLIAKCHNPLLELYEHKKHQIRRRLKDFQTFYSKPVVWEYRNKVMRLVPSAKTDDERLFEELSFCILTANGTAETGMNAVMRIRDILQDGSASEIQKQLIGCCRFHNRASYIVQNREFLKKQYNFKLRELLESFSDNQSLRSFLVTNIKGFGYKESSHFLRNVGFKGYGIIDKHILNSLKEFNVIAQDFKVTNPKGYLEAEQKLIEFSQEIGIGIDELDLLLWSRKTGQILK
ncbi:N-glycosylase/DNA lyase [Candidatus Woesearchaeota archaeon]|nr:N-glycosylase/DNA lyase [Candidatus Woesearchaeota archaeon]